MSTPPSTAAHRPTFLLIGAARSGTTFLARHLARHPELSFSEPKETHFLAFPGQPLTFRGPGDDETVNRAAVTDPEAWHALFSGPATARGEGSVSTMFHADTAVKTIEEHCPDVRLIAVLREPVERAYSAWLYQVGRGFEPLDFEAALDAEGERAATGWQHLWQYEAMGHYPEQLRPFIETFGRERLLVLDHAALDAAPEASLARCFRHVGLEPVPLSGLEAEVNSGGTPRSRALASVMQRARRIEPLRRAVKAAVPFGMRERIRAANLDRPPMPTGARDRLGAAYAPDHAVLVELLGDDAPDWAVAP